MADFPPRYRLFLSVGFEAQELAVRIPLDDRDRDEQLVFGEIRHAPCRMSEKKACQRRRRRRNS